MKISQLQQNLQNQQEQRSESIQQLHRQSLENLEKSLTELHSDIANRTEQNIIQAYNNLANSVEKQSKLIQEKLQEESEKPKDWQNLGTYAGLGFLFAILIFLFWRSETHDYQTRKIRTLEAWQIPQKWRATSGRKRYLKLNYEQEQGKIWTDKQSKTITIEIGR